MAAALDSVVLLSSSEMPPIVTQPATPGVPLRAASISLTVDSVRRERRGARQLHADDGEALVLLGQEARSAGA